MDSVLLWCKKLNNQCGGGGTLKTVMLGAGMLSCLSLWTQSATLALEHLTHQVTVRPEPGIPTTSPISSPLETTPAAAILQARGRVYVHGRLSTKMLNALRTLAQHRPTVTVRLLYPFTPAEFDSNEPLKRTFEQLTRHDLGWTLALTRLTAPSHSGREPCPRHPNAITILIDKHLYHGRYRPPAWSSHPSMDPSQASILILRQTSTYAAQQRFLRRFSTCATPALPLGVQPFTYTLAPHPRPSHISPRLPKTPKWMNERITESAYSSAHSTAQLPSHSNRATANPWQSHAPVEAEAHVGLPSLPPAPTFHHPHPSSSPNLWYNDQSYIHPQPSSP